MVKITTTVRARSFFGEAVGKKITSRVKKEKGSYFLKNNNNNYIYAFVLFLFFSSFVDIFMSFI